MFFRRHKHLTDEQRQSHIKDRRVHLANERTFLAWIRTSVAIMAFGLVVTKFSIFYQNHMQKQILSQQEMNMVSDIIGLSIVVLGCITGILATVRYVRTEKDIEKGRFRPSIILDLLFTAIFLILAAFLILHLMTARLIIGGA